MTEISYQNGDATQPLGDGPRVIVHICNNSGGWGKGFVLALSHRWRAPEAAYRDWHRTGEPRFALGEVQFVEVEPQLWVANLIGQHGFRWHNRRPPVRYDAIATGLATVAAFANQHKASVHLPRIGCGLAGGRWEEIEPLITAALLARDIPTFVYDFG